MTAGFNTAYQPRLQPGYQSYNQGYSQGYGMPQPAAQPVMQPPTQPQTQTYAQNPMPAQYQPQSYPQGYYFPQTPGIVNYVTPNQNMPVPQGQRQPLSNIPYEQNPLNMNTGFNPMNTPQNQANGPMNAQMPAPAIQNGQNAAMNAQASVAQPFMDIGVVNAPENFSKTPILDDLNRRGQTIERETPPKLRGKKTFTLGNVSAACSVGALGIILTMALCKVLKLIKHK